MAEVSAWIDGAAVTVAQGTTILEAAAHCRPAIEIPALCHRAGSAAHGGCRLCQVRVAGSEHAVAACSTVLDSGMVVTTQGPDIERARSQILRLLAERFPRAAAAELPGGGRNARQFRDLLARHGLLTDEGSATSQESRKLSGSHPYLQFDSEACIVCRRCVLACEDLQGQFVFSVGDRGGRTRLLFGETEQFGGSACVGCGACVEECPTGALFDVDRRGNRSDPGSPAVRSVCGYCGVGCNVDVVSDGDAIVSIAGTMEAAVNHGHLCAKGRYAHGWVRSADRLTQPLLRRQGALQPVSWDEAMAWAVARIRDIRSQHGPDALGLLTSSRSTNEAAYLLQKVFRAGIGTNNVDCCARVCHSSTALALRLATGTGAASASYADIERARIIVVAGANPTEAHPVIGARIKQAVRRGAKLIVIDPRVIELCGYADLHLQAKAGTNVALFNAIAKVLLESGLHDDLYVAQRTEGLPALRAHLKQLSLEAVVHACGVAPEAIRQTATLLGGEGRTLFVTGLGLSELTQGTDSVRALTNIALLLGCVGRSGGGLLPLRGQNNVQGNADMGCAPDFVTGYHSLADPQMRRRLEQTWGNAPPLTPGLTIPEMLAAARSGRVKGLWIQGEDVAQSDPNQAMVIESLQALDLLIIQEIFLSETARFAHLVLPAAGVLEQDGTFTNGERRVQRVRAVLRPPGAARPDWQVARDLGLALGPARHYAHPGEIMDEIATVAPSLFGGLSYSRLDGDGLQWPCPDRQHPGTPTVHPDGFVRGRAQFTVIEHADSPERPDADYPYLLITGRVLQHYNVGTMTRRTANIDLADRDWLAMNPSDVGQAGLKPGERVIVESRYGRCTVNVHATPDLPSGTVFLSFHFPETHANALTGPHHDPLSHCPEYKITAVRVRAAAAT